MVGLSNVILRIFPYTLRIWHKNGRWRSPAKPPSGRRARSLGREPDEQEMRPPSRVPSLPRRLSFNSATKMGMVLRLGFREEKVRVRVKGMCRESVPSQAAHSAEGPVFGMDLRLRTIRRRARGPPCGKCGVTSFAVRVTAGRWRMEVLLHSLARCTFLGQPFANAISSRKRGLPLSGIPKSFANAISATLPQGAGRVCGSVSLTTPGLVCAGNWEWANGRCRLLSSPSGSLRCRCGVSNASALCGASLRGCP